MQASDATGTPEVLDFSPESTRKPGAEGVAVTLADGRDWLVRRPRMRWVPDDGESGYAVTWDLGPEYDALHAAYVAADSYGQVYGAYLKMFAHLLRLNHALDAAQLRRLLVVSFRPMVRGDAPDAPPRDDAERLFRELEAIALGAEPAPKPTPDGSA